MRGERVNTVDPRTNTNISYNQFITIPFAEPPVGELRFAPPRPARSWSQPPAKTVPFTRVCYQAANAFGLLDWLDSDEERTLQA